MNTEHHRTPLKQLADHDMAIRSRVSGPVYLVLYGIIILFTPYEKDNTAIAVSVFSIILLLAIIRLWLIIKFDSIYPVDSNRWNTWFTSVSLFTGATWGIFCAHTVWHYDLEWTAMLTLLSTAGISAGAITTLSIHRNLITVFLLVLLLPSAVTTILLRTTEGYAITLMFLTYFTFMLIAARRINDEYWKALNNTLLLDTRAHELEASNQELESYSYSIAHDLRTPLRSIIGFSQILKEDSEDKLSSRESDSLMRIISAGKHMAKLIDDILELSRITRKDLEYISTDLSRLAAKHAENLSMNEADRSLSFNIEPGMRVNGDPRLLDLALQNLIENAVKFTSSKEHSEISFSSKKQNGDTIYCVCDNGAGFDMAHSDKLFKPFERLHNQAEFPGTGTGLATVHRIIMRHGGRIWAESNIGNGACFYFTLK